MKFLLTLMTLATLTCLTAGASLPQTRGQDPASAPREPEGDRREGNAFSEELEPFEIIVPVARNFSSLEELFQILREDPKEHKVDVTVTAPSYVKGTERNSSEYLLFLTDGVGGNQGS